MFAAFKPTYSMGVCSVINSIDSLEPHVFEQLLKYIYLGTASIKDCR